MTTAGLLSQGAVGSTTATIVSAAATGGAAPYTYQLYRSTTTGFTPGAGNLIPGATTLSYNDSGLIPNTAYFYKMVATDSGAVSGTSSQLAVVTTATSLSQNQFSQSVVLGMVDQAFNFNTRAVLIDVSQVTPLFQGSAVKMVDSADGCPKVVGCSANSDEVLGFINYDIRNISFVAGNAAEISLKDNVIYLYATSAISRGAQVQLDLSSPGAVTAMVASSGADLVGFAYDKAVAPGALIRVNLSTPSFQKA